MTILALTGAVVFAVSTFGVVIYNCFKPSKPKTECVKKQKTEKTDKTSN